MYNLCNKIIAVINYRRYYWHFFAKHNEHIQANHKSFWLVDGLAYVSMIFLAEIGTYVELLLKNYIKWQMSYSDDKW